MSTGDFTEALAALLGPNAKGLRASQREKFGKSSEKLSPDQFNLALEDAELAQGVLEAARGRRPRRRCGPPRARMRPAGLRATLAICRRICPGSSG